MPARLRKFLALPAHDKLLLAQAWFMLGWYRAAILLLPFQRLTVNFERSPQPTALPSLSPSALEEARRIGHLVAVAARYTPWQSLCLVQVLVVQQLLARRSIPGQFYLGAKKGEISARAPDGISAHAWLRCGDFVVSGEVGCEEFAILSAFSWLGTEVGR